MYNQAIIRDYFLLYSFSYSTKSYRVLVYLFIIYRYIIASRYSDMALCLFSNYISTYIGVCILLYYDRNNQSLMHKIVSHKICSGETIIEPSYKQITWLYLRTCASSVRARILAPKHYYTFFVGVEFAYINAASGAITTYVVGVYI